MIIPRPQEVLREPMGLLDHSAGWVAAAPAKIVDLKVLGRWFATVVVSKWYQFQLKCRLDQIGTNLVLFSTFETAPALRD